MLVLDRYLLKFASKKNFFDFLNILERHYPLNLLPIFNSKNILVHRLRLIVKILDLVEPEERLFFFRAIFQTKLTDDALVKSVYTITNLEKLCDKIIR